MLTAEDWAIINEDMQALRKELTAEFEAKLEERLAPPEPEEPPGLLPEAERIAAVPAWDAARVYHEGEVCRHQDKLWIAMVDVAPGFHPDETYDLKANTGGWRPAA